MRAKEGPVRTIAYFETLPRKKGVRDALGEKKWTDLRRPHLMEESA